MKYREIILETALPPQPKRENMLDAIQHANWEGHKWTLSNFELKYEGYLTVDEIRQFDDLSGWLEASEPADMETFRKGSFSGEAREMPPIIVITAPDEGRPYTQIGDGRGRVNFAAAHNMRLHVWHMIFKRRRRK
jgi:hypothetical protein